MVVTLRLSLNYSLLFLHLREWKFRHTSIQILSYKYTNSNQYSRKLVKQKLYIFFMYYREFLLCCFFFLNGESKKQTHLCRTIELSDYRAVGLTGCRIIATLPFKIVCDFIVQFRIVRIYLSELSSFTITYFNVSNNLNFRARISK